VEIEEPISRIHEQMTIMTGEEIMEMIGAIMEGYCTSCGRNRVPCYCCNDE
jgi:hypothetical protein